ncbi:UDP-Glycosyltransferase/glycogen phosphorylase [Trametes polyzona]|nr:UDP-Glycosyltransferase/glycogen phosphorylase [Trametes polyzona]
MTASPAAPEGHIILLANGPWADPGRQLCVFAARVVKLRPSVNVTVFTNQAIIDRAKREVLSELAGARDAGRICIVGLPAERHSQFVDPVFEAAFDKTYRQILAGERIRCASTGDQYGPFAVPQAIVTPKNSTLDALRRLRTKTGSKVKLFAWYARAPSTLFFFHGPRERGGVGDVRAKTVLFLDSTLIRVPGYDPIYGHEIQPQELPYHGTLGVEWLTIYDMFTACDGALLTSPECFDPLSILGVRAWMGDSARDAYAVGPLLPTGAGAVENELVGADKGTEVRDFVSTIFKSHGPLSLLYISLGTWMWPKYPEKMWTFLDVVMELGIPFIMSHASEYAEVPQEVRDKVERYQLGLLSSWCPQQMILSHPVTGWFLTHCGHNSVMESISAGVPMICWPFVGDGALNAIHLTDTLKCAYELLEVRTGHGLERIYRTGARPAGSPAAIRAEARRVLTAAFSRSVDGGDGARLRANVRKMQARFGEAWMGGEGKAKAKGRGSVRATEAFLDGLGL